MSLLKSAHGGNTREAAEWLGISPEQLLDFSANINPLGMPVSLKRAIIDNLDCTERYPDVDYVQLHAALAEHHQIPSSWILAGNGETESIFTLVHGLKPRQAMIVTPRVLRNIVVRCNGKTVRFMSLRCAKTMAGNLPMQSLMR
ncbi:threonine-phosphate decarboxylase [Citrobacter freundii]|nr:threonine-phosphate decarboxylase [Citrobacter freundii]